MFINIDGAGYQRGRTAFSFYNVAAERIERSKFRDLLAMISLSSQEPALPA